MSDIRKNIFSLYVIKISKWFSLIMPIIVLFYQDNGMGMHEIFVLKAIYSMAIVIMEIPSGWMADVWGRKKTLILGSILSTGGILIYSFSFDFLAFAVAEIVLGVGHSFVSGADSAMLYDTLKANKRSGDYVKFEGRITSLGNFAEAIAGIAGGFLAAISLRTPFYYQFVVAALAIPATLALKEPKFHADQVKLSVKKLVNNIKTTFLSNQNLRISILLSALTGTSTLTFAWFVQPFFKEINLPVEWFGILWTALNLAVGLSSIIAYKVENLLGNRNAVIIIVSLLATGYFLTGLNVSFLGITFLFLFYVVRGIATPIFKNYINQYTESQVRATMLSVRNFIIRISFAVIGPLLGWITDNINLKSAFLLAGGIYIITALITIFPWLKKGRFPEFEKRNQDDQGTS